jgi:HAD superfamily hydrolase (TIGR01509 family)
MIGALVFDFDGLVVDTETPEFTAWSEVFAAHGATLAETDWAAAVGYVGNLDPRRLFEERTGLKPDWTKLDAARSARHLALIAGQPALPGVERLMREGRAAGWRVGIASNSTPEWVRAGLERVGLAGYVEAIRGRGTVGRLKPAPDLYLAVLADLGADAACSLAFEDSEPGVLSARAAGLHVIAVPRGITRHQDHSKADRIVASLEDFELPDRCAAEEVPA